LERNNEQGEHERETKIIIIEIYGKRELMMQNDRIR
jgi:hypothetical protein